MAKDLIAEETRVSPAFQATDDDLGELLLDCHVFLTALLDRRHAKWVDRDARRLLERLGELVEWETVH